MSLPHQMIVDLLACLGAPDGHMRFAASVILSRECVARFSDAERLYPGVAPTHPAFGDLAIAGLTSGLDALLSSVSKPSDVATKAAKWFARNDVEPNGVHYLDGEMTRPPRAVYQAAEDQAETQAAQLRALAVAAMGAPAFAAARAPYVEQLALLSTKTGVAWFGVLASAGPGEAFRVHTRNRHQPGFTFLGTGSTGPWEIAVPTVGTYSFNFHGAVCSGGTGPGVEAAVAIDVGGVEVAGASYTATRASSDVAEAIDIGDTREYFRAGQAGTLTVDDVAKKIRVRNGSVNTQTIGGMLVIWQ